MKQHETSHTVVLRAEETSSRPLLVTALLCTATTSLYLRHRQTLDVIEGAEGCTAHGKDSIGVRFPLVVVLQKEMKPFADNDKRVSNLAHTTADDQMLQNSENKLLPERCSVMTGASAHEHNAHLSAGEKSS
jgi:hypothetical protein